MPPRGPAHPPRGVAVTGSPVCGGRGRFACGTMLQRFQCAINRCMRAQNLGLIKQCTCHTQSTAVDGRIHAGQICCNMGQYLFRRNPVE